MRARGPRVSDGVARGRARGATGSLAHAGGGQGRAVRRGGGGDTGVAGPAGVSRVGTGTRSIPAGVRGATRVRGRHGPRPETTPRAGPGGRTLGRAGATCLPVPVPVPAEARQAPWPHRPPPCSKSAGGRARDPPRPRSRSSWWGTGAAGRRLCCWPSPAGTSPRYGPPCPLGPRPPVGHGGGEGEVTVPRRGGAGKGQWRGDGTGTVVATGPFAAGHGAGGDREGTAWG